MSLGRIVIATERRDAARRRRPAARLPRVSDPAPHRMEGGRLDRFVFLTFDGLSPGRGVRRVRAGAGADLARRPDRQLRAGRDGGRDRVRRRTRVSDATGSYWLGFVVALVGGLLLGAVVERAVMRFVGHSVAAQRRSSSRSAWCWSSRRVLGMIYGNEFRPATGAVRAATRSTSAGCALLSPLRPVRLRRGGSRWSCCWRCCSPGPRSACGCGRRRSRPRCRGCSASTSAGCSRSAGRWPRRSARWPGCWSSRPSWACTRTRWTWCSSRRSPRRSSAGWTARSARWSAGSIVGLLLSYVSGYLGGDVTPIAVLVLLLVVLLVRPGGLFSRSPARHGMNAPGQVNEPGQVMPPGRRTCRGGGPDRRGRPCCVTSASRWSPGCCWSPPATASTPFRNYQLATVGRVPVRDRRADRPHRTQRAALARARRVDGGRRVHRRADPERVRRPRRHRRLDAAGVAARRRRGHRVAAVRSSAWPPPGCAGPYLAGVTLAVAVVVPAVTITFDGVFNGDQGLSVLVEPPPLALGPYFPLRALAGLDRLGAAPC